MAKVYTHPDEIKAPVLNFTKIKEYDAECDKFCKELADWCKKRNPSQEHIGEIISFPVADGKAQYMVAAIKPVQLIHLPLWDAWQFQYASRLTSKDIKEKVAQQKSIATLFTKK